LFSPGWPQREKRKEKKKYINLKANSQPLRAMLEVKIKKKKKNYLFKIKI
jgi:hypothetical protein